VWTKRVLYRREQRTRSDLRQAKIVQIPEEKKEKSSMAQRGKDTAKQCTVRRTRKHSKG